MESTWTITDLADRATAILAADPSAKVNGRVRDMPNTRLIRWYTTIGLVDPPPARRGRLALYGERHLLQLVAIKRRQAAGRTIAQIQAELTGATDDTLRRIARLPGATAPGPLPASATGDDARHEDHEVPPGHAGRAGRAGEDGGAARPEPARTRFWTEPPAPAPAEPDAAAGALPGGGAAGPALVRGVRLASGALLVLDAVPEGGDPAADLGPQDLAAIGRAAGPLLRELRRHRLIPDGDHAVILPAAPSDPSDQAPGRST